MTDPPCGPVRIWEGAAPAPPRARAPGVDLDADLGDLARSLAEQELLRSSPRSADPPEPLSLAWYVALENLRHGRHGRWLPRLLEFSRHPGDRVLGLGGGLGSDWARYATHGAEVVTACPHADQLALVRRNFELRGLRGTFLHAAPTDLPLAAASIDVAVVMGLLHEEADPAALVEEVYRVLKPGGKVLAVVPARYDAEFWGRWSLFGPARSARHTLGTTRGPGDLLAPTSRRFSRRDLLRLFSRFVEPRVHKRHLRRSEAPHLWRWLPLSLLQRWMGRLLIYKGFKPVSAALPTLTAAA